MRMHDEYYSKLRQKSAKTSIRDVKFIKIRSGECCEIMGTSGDMLVYNHPKEGIVHLYNGKMFIDKESPIDMVSYCSKKNYPELYL